MPTEASFCGKCGHAPAHSAQQNPRIDDLPTRQLASAGPGEANTLTPSGRLAFSGESTGPLRPLTLVPFEEDREEVEDEEEKRRRAALLGLALPLVGGLADQQPLGRLPGIQGTPQQAQFPGIQGTPGLQGSIPSSPGTPAVASGPPPVQRPGAPPPHRQPPSGQHGGSPGGSPASSPGCLTLVAIIVATALIILAIIIGLGLTLLAPDLALSGNSHVAPGGSMTLHGSNFLPHSSVTLTLDGGTPLYVLRTPPGGGRHATGAGLVQAASNMVPVQSDGTFTITFQANPSWLLGPHIVHASESVSHRSASLPFTIVESGASVTPTPTSGPAATPTSSPTATPTPTPAPTTAPPAVPFLSCLAPGKLTLGPLSERSSQTASGNVTLCAGGSGTLTWQARWNQQQAPWLHMARISGSVLAPGQFQAAVSASVTNLAAGTYTATITFIGLQSNSIRTLTVGLTVQASCLRVGPLSLSFVTAVGSNPNPDTQTISLTNCGLTSNWSATAATSDGNNWLAVNPGNGTLQGNSSRQITVAINALSLATSTYNGTVTLKLGAKTIAVAVTLTVDPLITAGPQLLNPTCTTDQNGNAICTLTLGSTPGGLPLSWSATADQRGVTIKPGNDTIAAGGSETVTIVFSICVTTIITFFGPANSAAVTWDCTPVG